VSGVADRTPAAQNITSLFTVPHISGRKRDMMRPVALEITAGDFTFPAGHRRCALSEARRLHISLRSRCTAMLAGLRTLIQTRHGPD
jgi:hypothetical protein